MMADLFEVCSEPLLLDRYTRAVHSDSAGAVSTFTGVTRDTFNGERVLRLEYEAYVPMAEKKMRAICDKVREKWKITAIAIGHRVGVVGVGEPSVMIAVSSPHRREALEACHFAIDDLKATVPVWKKEFYENGEVWKENAEGQYLREEAPPAQAA